MVDIVKNIAEKIDAVTQLSIDVNSGKIFPSLTDILNSLLSTTIGGFGYFSYISSVLRNRLLSLNSIEYFSGYVLQLPYDYKEGSSTTIISNNVGDYNYNQTTNIQWNENNSSMIPQDDSTSSSFYNENSLLYKTKMMFNNKMIDTIVSRFHTEGYNDSGDNLGKVSTPAYGMSRGRNLLTKEAENGENPFTDGYENPYCRVWTHYHQYNSIDKLIRPFIKDGSPTSIGELQKPWTFIRGSNGANKLNKGTVMNKNGFVNIATTYEPDSAMKIPTKKCMFSIENLAWKGYSKYDFEKSLSWEQRGPMGGRIMWFPPYDLSFSENTNVNWNADSFIGRGEKVYTYVDTDRSGTLHFKLVVDHPSIINYYEGNNKYSNNSSSNSLLDQPIGITIDEKFGNAEAISELNKSARQSLQNILDSGFNNNNNRTKTVKGNGEAKDTELLRFFAGCDTIEGKAKNLTDETVQETISILNRPTKKTDNKTSNEVFTEEEPETEGKFIFYVYYPNNYSGVDDKPGNTVEAMAYLLNGMVCQKQSDGTTDGFLQFNNLRNELVSSGVGNGYEMSRTYGVSHGYSEGGQYGSIKGKYMNWQYRVDKSTVDQKLLYESNEVDEDSTTSGSQNGLNIDKSLGWQDADYSFAEFAYAASGIELIKNKASSISGFDDNVSKIKEILSNGEVLKITSEGLANTHGNNSSEVTNEERNETLARNRGQSVLNWLSSLEKFKSVEMVSDTYDVDMTTTKNVSDIDAKKKRAAKVTVYYKVTSTKNLSDSEQEQSEDKTATNFQEDRIVKYAESPDGSIEYGSYVNPETKEALYFVKKDGEWQPDTEQSDDDVNNMLTTVVSKTQKDSFNNFRYDQEYHFFKVLKEKAPFVFEKFTEKIKYFTPAFHSMTPEGFNGRLNFLHQCTRQGNTVGLSDTNAKTATNLAFGAPPVCVLRLGDFYYTKIVITSVSHSFDPLVWDLNSEGIGVQPLIADVTINFNFIGGSDLNGPIARLQNAMTFNYYANTGVYDNRADSVEYGDYGDIKNYTAYTTPMTD